MLGWAWFGRGFWEKLHYADRLEELWLDKIMEEETALKFMPQSVVAYDRSLDEYARYSRNALADLGFTRPPDEQPRPRQT